MKTTERNGKKMKGMYAILQRTGQGVKFAADAGYRTGYFMAKHPNVKMTKDQIQKNYKVGLIALAGIVISMFSIIKLMSKLKK